MYPFDHSIESHWWKRFGFTWFGLTLMMDPFESSFLLRLWFIRFLRALGNVFQHVIWLRELSFCWCPPKVCYNLWLWNDDLISLSPFASSSLFIPFDSDMLQVKRAMIDTISRFVFFHIFYSVLVDMISVV